MDVTPETIPFIDLGISGVKRFGGTSRVYEEFLVALQGPNGAKLYSEMSQNCPITGAILFAAQHLARGVTARVDPANRKGANPRDALRIADRVSGALFDDLETTWPDTLSEILSMLTFGWSMMEMSWKRCQGTESPRPASAGESLMPPDQASAQGALPDPFTPSKFNDGWMTWKSWGLRAQETLFMWEWDDNSRAIVMQQMAPPDYKVRRIPIKKCLHFRTQVAKQNPEGVSLLRHGMTSYLNKKNVLWVEGVGLERDLAGYPVFQMKMPDVANRFVPPDIWNANDPNAVRALAELKKIARSVKRDDQEGMVLPNWVEFKLMGSGGSRKSSFDTNQIIERYEQRILMSLLADFIMLGHSETGSRSLGETKSQLFSQALTSILNIIASVINRFAFPELLRFNGIPQELCPTLVFGAAEEVSLEQLGGYVANLAKAGMPMFPDGDLENYLRDAAGMPNTDPNARIGDSSATEAPLVEEPDKPAHDPELAPEPAQAREETKKWFDLASKYTSRPNPGMQEAVVRLADGVTRLTADVGALKAQVAKGQVPPPPAAPPVVHVHQAPTTITMPEMKPPNVHVHEAPINVTVPASEPRVVKRTQTVHRDKAQLITHVETTEEK